MHTVYSHRKSTHAFTLVEVVLAMAVMTFACLTLLALLGTGLTSVRQAIGTTVQAQIMQSVANSSEIQSYASGNFTNSAGTSPAVLLFDDEGTSLPSTATTYAYSATVTAQDLYVPGQATQMTRTNIASLLQVVIASKAQPAKLTTNTLIWPNFGK